MLKVNNLQFERNDQALFKPLNFSLEAGNCLQLCGPNGVGKTTILRIITGLAQARRGSLLWQNHRVLDLSKHAKYLGHELALKPYLTVYENLTYYAALMHANPAEILVASDFFDLKSLLNKQVHQLSAGQKHRCQLAKLLIAHRPIWLLDEPFTALDQQHIQQMLFLFKKFLDNQGCIIFTSHQNIQIADHPIHQYWIEHI